VHQFTAVTLLRSNNNFLEFAASFTFPENEPANIASRYNALQSQISVIIVSIRSKDSALCE